MTIVAGLGKVLLGAAAVVLVVALVVRDHGGSNLTYTRMLAALPTGYNSAGRYVGPLKLNVAPPEVVLGADGIPLVRYASGYQRNPTAVAQYGLWAYGMYVQDRNAKYRRLVLHVADWLVDHQDLEGRWIYHFDFDTTGRSIRAPWSSAMAQGQAMSVLERAYRLDDDRRYLRAAEKALRPFHFQVASGGLTRCFRGDCSLPWFEEYPTVRPCEVLNGFMFTLIGLYDLSSISPGSGARGLYLAGRRTLAVALASFDHGGLARYDLASPVLASPMYQAIHVYLLRALNYLSANRTFTTYADTWAAHLATAN